MNNYSGLKDTIIKEKMPRHIAVIMDGNGRWAKRRGKSRIFGHQAGVKTVRAIIEASVDIGLEYLTLYAFSTENWKRPVDEVSWLLKMIKNYLIKEIEELAQNNVVVRFIGSQDRLDSAYVKALHKVAEKSRKNTGLNLNIAMNYGGRIEITEAFRKISALVKTGSITPEQIDEDLISGYLYTSGMPDPDLVIRTSGEIRLSNYLIWQSAYSEFWFTETLWPDFTKEEYFKAIIDYMERTRRFGEVK